jgi:hypothetical protein
MIVCSDWFVGLSPEETSVFNGVVLISGIYDLKPLVSTYVNDALVPTL